MKRTNVILDETLLEEARQASGERTYSGAITKALQELVRVKRLREGLREIHGTADEYFAPGYLEEYYATHDIDFSLIPKPKKRVAASSRALPKTKSAKRRGSR